MADDDSVKHARLVAGVALLAVPVLVAVGPVAAVVAAHPDTTRPTLTLTQTTPTVHLDKPPPGVDVHRSPSTQALVHAAGLDRALSRGPARVGSSAADLVPPGAPTTSALGAHVSPSCGGTGADGNRVQVAYVTQAGGTDRYTSVVAALRSYVADVDDVMAVSAAETGGGRRVRWVTDAACVPVVQHVVLPAGSLGAASSSDGGFGSTVTAMKNAGYKATNRKYLMFVESTNLCGIAQIYPSSVKTGNPSDGGTPMYARVDSACWTSSYHSVAAHELMHTLGSVQADAPHHSAAWHCTDEADDLCYVDGTGVTMQNVCATSHEQLYDCGHDDYFSTDPLAGGYLATHWNTADSSFLDVVPRLGAAATLTVDAPATLRPGLSTVVSLVGTQPVGATYSWSTVPSVCLVGSHTSVTATVMCPADVTGPVTVSAYRTSAGIAEFGSATIQPAAVGPDALTLGLAAPAPTVYAGTVVTMVGALSWTGKPVRGTVSFYRAPTAGGTWTLVVGPLQTDASGAYHLTVRVSVPQRYKVVVTLPTGSTWTATQPSVSINAVKRGVVLAATVAAGRPDIVRARLYTTSAGVAAAPVRVWVRFSTTAAWTLLLPRTTDAYGWAYVSVQPRKRAYYYWTYAGSVEYLPAHSAVVTVSY